MQRTRILLLAVAVVAVAAVSAVVSFKTLRPTEANPGTTAMQLGATGTGVTCNSPSDPTSCTVPLSGVFNVEVSVTAFPPDPDAGGPQAAGYSAMATDVDWCTTCSPGAPASASPLTYTKLANAIEVPWPQRGNLIVSNSPHIDFPNTRIQHGDVSTASGSVPSTFKGVIVRLQFTCSAGNSSTPLALVIYDPGTNPGGTTLTDVAGNNFPASDTLTINCGSGPVPTATVAGPTATTGPTNTPGPTSTAGPPTNTPLPRTATPVPPPRTATPVIELGDVNKNGAVDSIDAALVLQHDAGLLELDNLDHADVNRDGEVNAVDALFILWIDAGLYP